MVLFGFAALIWMAVLFSGAFVAAYISTPRVLCIDVDMHSEAGIELLLFMFLWFAIGYFAQYFARLVMKNAK